MLPRRRHHHDHHHHGHESSPPLRGRMSRADLPNGKSLPRQEGGEAATSGAPGLPPSPTLPHKGGGSHGHNSAIADELHSHLHGEGECEDLQALAEAFIDGFRQSDDKTSYLRLAGVPDTIEGPDGLARRLVDVTVTDGFQVATASPGFGSRELVYLPYPGAMVRPRTTLTLIYVSLTGRSDVDLVDLLAGRFGKQTR
jgi:hypothetical protein